MKTEAILTGKRWDFCAEGYSDIIQQEFVESGEVWMHLLEAHQPCLGGRVLDIGTGPGFFAMLLAMAGWNVTGIDCAQAMVEIAGRNAENRSLSIDFRQMDSHFLLFPDNSFDYIVARNATWLLYDPEKAFSEWLRVLRPGGRLLYIDANWPYIDDPVLLERTRKANADFEKEHGTAFNTYRGDEATNDSFQDLVAFRHILRPDWDRAALPMTGFCNICVTERINEIVYSDWKQKLYDHMNLFLITADKPKETGVRL